ncbi:hypothetical protein RN001_005913 [Aquatica leii]|uniref:Cilia- and flagella-associated protein 157 n=1 Tax=Aquatica leii TaxID=1421715 RepID=A0AAN7PCY9_9COLE|nr:hypothetical protein RN001_005913 [Aquatica leii]
MKKKANLVKRSSLSEVDRIFYELSINSVNSKINKLKTTANEYVERNQEIETLIKDLTEKQKDEVNHYKRVINNQNKELSELYEKIHFFETDNLPALCEITIQEIKNDYERKREELTTKIKELNGKLNNLEKFKMEKDALIAKFEKQQSQINENEIKHKREMYDICKRFTMAKNQLKMDMESNLAQLSTDFQNITASRITTTTHRVIRENIAIDNDLELILESNQRLHNENVNLKKLNTSLKLDTKLHQKEKNDAIDKSEVQLKLIRTLTQQHNKLCESLNEYKTLEIESVTLKRELQILANKKDTIERQLRVLEQNFHASKCEENSLQTDLDYTKLKYDNILLIIYESMMTVKNFLNKNATMKFTNRYRINLLKNLLSMMTIKDQNIKHPSIESVKSLSHVCYNRSLGFEPLGVVLRSTFPVKLSKQVQIGPSFEEFVQQQFTTASILTTEEEKIEDEEEKEEEYKQKKDVTLEEAEQVVDIFSFEKESLLFTESSELSPNSSTPSETNQALSTKSAEEGTVAEESELQSEEVSEEEEEEFCEEELEEELTDFF